MRTLNRQIVSATNHRLAYWGALALPLFLAHMACAGDVGDEIEAPGITVVRQALTTAAMGFAWVNGTEVSPLYSHNSAGGVVTATNPSVGRYEVTFVNLGGPGGNVQVVAYGEGPARCKVESWSTGGTDQLVRVRCHDGGVAANAPFVVKYGRPDGAPDGFGAFLWADRPTAPAYEPHPSFSFNTAGGTNRISREGVGRYHVFLPNLSDAAGSIEVTAYGDGSEYCKVQSYWFTVAAGERNRREAIVNCFDGAGAPRDARFSLSYSGPNEVGVSDLGGYAAVNEPTLAFHNPSRSFSSGIVAAPAICPGVVNAGRINPGQHLVMYPLLEGRHSAVHVTAAGTTPNHCKVLRWSKIGDVTLVLIRCFTPDGRPADSSYVTTYASSLSRMPVRDLVLDALTIETLTGGDDVREGSQVNAELQLASGGTMPSTSLNNGANWPNNSFHFSTLPVSPPQRLGDLFSLKITWDGAERRDPDAYDNWNLDSLRIGIQLPGGCTYHLGPTYTPGRLTGSRHEWSTPLQIP